MHVKVPQYGIDVAATRIDDLDRQVLKRVAGIRNQQANGNTSVLELGCGRAGLAVPLTLAGASVTGVDIADYRQEYTSANSSLGSFLPKIQFVNSDIQTFCKCYAGETFTLGHFQRTLHFLTYLESIQVLTQLSKMIHTALFISVTGLEAPIAKAYRAKDQLVTERFLPLSFESQSLFSITEPVCLYSMEEFSILLSDTGWYVDEVWTSSFGNHKAIAHPRSK